MIKIFNKTQNEVVSETFWSFPEVRDFLSSNEYGKEDVLIVYAQDEDGTQTDVLKIEHWGSTIGGLDSYFGTL